PRGLFAERLWCKAKRVGQCLGHLRIATGNLAEELNPELLPLGNLNRRSRLEVGSRRQKLTERASKDGAGLVTIVRPNEQAGLRLSAHGKPTVLREVRLVSQMDDQFHHPI